MQLLQGANDPGTAPQDCAAALLVSVPAVMRFVRTEMRARRRSGLSVPQFRALIFVSVNCDTSISSMAEHLGLSVPAASRMVDGLVRRGLLARRARSGDRRSVSLSLTARGRAAYRTARRATQAALARRFELAPPAELTLVRRALEIIGRVFGAEGAECEKLK